MSIGDLIRERREKIEKEAPCESCGASLESCQAERGKDPTAPPWFGCCARGLLVDIPCDHRPSEKALRELLREAESGHVRTVGEVEDQDLLDSITGRPRLSMRWKRLMWKRLMEEDPDIVQGYYEDATWD